jgi:hypothetical protein
MRSLLLLILLTLLSTSALRFRVHAAPAAPVFKHLTSIIKWTRSSTKGHIQSDATVVQFEEGYLVETVVQGNELGGFPYSVRVSEDGELFAVDADNSNIVRITPPLSHYSRSRLVAGSFQGYTGHADGKPNDARFNHPKGVTMDNKGNIYVADTSNFAIRKIGEAGVTTIAGGKSNVAGYTDGPSEDAKFSNDFDVIYVRPTCSLLVIDRGNAALRQIFLNQEDCDYQQNSVSSTDVIMVLGAIIIGYATCMLQQGYGQSILPQMQKSTETASLDQPFKDKQTPIIETIKEEQEAKWPSFSQLLTDLSKLALESLASFLLYFNPFRLKEKITQKTGLTPLKDSLVMPEDVPAKKNRTPPPQSETQQVQIPNLGDKYSEMKATKIRSSSYKDPSLSNKHRSSKRQELADFYGSGETPPQTNYGRSKSNKERSKHRQREKSGEVEQKPLDTTTNDDQKFGHYSNNNMRSKYSDSYRYE